MKALGKALASIAVAITVMVLLHAAFGNIIMDVVGFVAPLMVFGLVNKAKKLEAKENGQPDHKVTTGGKVLIGMSIAICIATYLAADMLLGGTVFPLIVAMGVTIIFLFLTKNWIIRPVKKEKKPASSDLNESQAATA